MDTTPRPRSAAASPRPTTCRRRTPAATPLQMSCCPVYDELPSSHSSVSPAYEEQPSAHPPAALHTRNCRRHTPPTALRLTIRLIPPVDVTGCPTTRRCPPTVFTLHIGLLRDTSHFGRPLAIQTTTVAPPSSLYRSTTAQDAESTPSSSHTHTGDVSAVTIRPQHPCLLSAPILPLPCLSCACRVFLVVLQLPSLW